MLNYKGYQANVKLKNNMFIGVVTGIKDFLIFHGYTIKELQEQFEICIDDYIEMCKQFGKEPEKAECL